MRPTAHVPDARLAARPQVALIPIGLHVALVVADDVGRHPCGPTRLIPVDHHRRRRRPAAGHPYVAARRVGASRLVEHLHGRFVDLQDRSAAQLVVQRCQQRPTGAGDRQHPVGHRAPRHRHSQPRELLLLPVQRQRVAELRRGDERQQPLAGDSFADQRRRRRRHPHRRTLLVAGALAVMAGVLRPHRAEHPHLRRDHVELLGGLLADADHAVAAGALLVCFGKVDDPLDPRQRRRQRLAARAPGAARHRGGRRFGRQWVDRQGVVGAPFDLVEQPDLLLLGSAQLFAAAPVPPVSVPGELLFIELNLLVQLLDLMIQRMDLMIQRTIPGDE